MDSPGTEASVWRVDQQQPVARLPALPQLVWHPLIEKSGSRFPCFLAHICQLSVKAVNSTEAELHGYLAHQQTQPPEDQHRALDKGPLKGPTGKRFLMSEVSL